MGLYVAVSVSMRGEAMARLKPCKEEVPTKMAYSIPEACCLTSIGRSLFYSMLKQGKGPRTFKIGNRKLIRSEDLANWILKLPVIEEVR
jgi:predicted DNA-binding transcriptional regulator AlpA